MPDNPVNASVIVVAAGNGLRMGSPVPKVLLPLGGETILERSVNTFLSVAEVAELVVVCRAEDREKISALPYCNPRGVALAFVDGGRVRQESVLRGLQHLADGPAGRENRLVAVHDAARCFVRPAVIAQAIQSAAEKEAVTVAVPLVDSIKRVGSDGKVERSLRREEVWCVQTPQVFRFDLLYRAHKENLYSGLGSGATDDASLVEAFHPVYVSAGERGNFKVTTPEDYELAQVLATMGGR